MYSLVATSYVSGFINSVIITSKTFTLSFCGKKIIDDFFRDLFPLESLPVIWSIATRLYSILYLSPMSSLSSCLFLPPTFSSLLPSQRSTPPKAASRPSPLVALTWQLSPCTTVPSSSFTPDEVLAMYWKGIKGIDVLCCGVSKVEPLDL